MPASSTRPGDRPRAVGEDVFHWAETTGRFSPDDTARWVDKINRGVTTLANVEWLAEVLAPGTGVPVTIAASRTPSTPKLQNPAQNVAAAAGGPVQQHRPVVDPAANPAIADLLAMPAGGNVFNDAFAASSAVPTLFPGGDLPAVTASGIDPGVLRSVPWPARHAIAAAPTRAEAQELLEAASGPDGADAIGVMPGIADHPGNGDYLARVQRWVDGGTRVFAAREQARHRAQQERQVAATQAQHIAASAPTLGEEAASDWETLGFGKMERDRQERRDEFLQAAREGRTVAGFMMPARGGR